eukprot:8538036-Alexandrium_andersonii.AAC.1
MAVASSRQPTEQMRLALAKEVQEASASAATRRSTICPLCPSAASAGLRSCGPICRSTTARSVAASVQAVSSNSELRWPSGIMILWPGSKSLDPS